MPSVATTISRWQPPMPLSLPLPLSLLLLLPTSTATPLLSMTLWWTARLTDWLTVHPAAHPDRPPQPSPICSPIGSHSHSPICWSWHCWCCCWCWCCIDMQLTEPRDGFESGMGQLTQRDLFYRRMHFLWLNDSWSFLNAATAVNQPTNQPTSSLCCLQNNWTIGSCQWGSAPKKREEKTTAPYGSAEIYS